MKTFTAFCPTGHCILSNNYSDSLFEYSFINGNILYIKLPSMVTFLISLPWNKEKL